MRIAAYAVLIVLAMGAAAILAGPAQAAMTGSAAMTSQAGQMSGVVTSLNPGAHRLMISTSHRVIHVNRQTSIMQNNRRVALSHLRVGDHVMIMARPSRGRWVASRIELGAMGRVAGAQGAEMRGILTSLNPQARRLMISTSREVIYLSPQAQVMREGRAVQLSELRTGEQAMISAQRSGGRLLATRIEVMPARAAVAGAEAAEMRGEISSVSVDQNQLMISTAAEPVMVTSETKIMYQGRSLTLSELKRGSQVQVMAHRQDGRLVATSIEVMEEPSMAAPERPAEPAAPSSPTY